MSRPSVHQSDRFRTCWLRVHAQTGLLAAPALPSGLQILNSPAKLASFELQRHQTADITAYFPNMLAAAMLENEINFNKQSLCVDLSWMQLLLKLRHGVRGRGRGASLRSEVRVHTDLSVQQRRSPPLCHHAAAASSEEHEGGECTAGGGWGGGAESDLGTDGSLGR